MTPKYEPCPGNAPGPFYVVAGGCVGCRRGDWDDDVKRAVLMDLFIFPGQHCRFVVQPTPRELPIACNAVRVCSAAAIRYAGDDKTILDQINRPESCDAMPR